MYIDTHCHVFSEYYDDIEEIVRKCKENNVTKIIVSGCDMKSNMEVLELANVWKRNLKLNQISDFWKPVVPF